MTYANRGWLLDCKLYGHRISEKLGWGILKLETGYFLTLSSKVHEVLEDIRTKESLNVSM